MINKNLLLKSKSDEGKVFLQKMAADYYRYVAEYSSGDQKNQYARDAEKAYETANKLAHTCLSPTHPIRLGLALNYSVFFYEIKQNAAKAC